MTDSQHTHLERFGFTFSRGGAHLSRTMMLGELETLLSATDRPNATQADYRHAIVEENCLGKRSQQTRALTYRHLADLYSLDPQVTLFRTLSYFWSRDPQAHPLLALLSAYARDAVLRMSAPFILTMPQGTVTGREEMEAFLDSVEPGRFSKATLRSTAQNLNGTWTQAGHLMGKVRKVRTRPEATPGAVAYALLLGYLTGARGESLFRSEYVRLLDCPVDRAVELAEVAARQGWIVFKRVGDVIEVLFPQLLTAQEQEWIREQS
jgi:hypothetical protein